jgi:hypothetical protein
VPGRAIATMRRVAEAVAAGDEDVMDALAAAAVACETGDREATMANCVGCLEPWSDDRFPVLVIHVEIDTTRDGAVLSFLCPDCSTAPTAELRAMLVRVACEVVPGEVDRVDDVMPTAGHA